MATSASVSTDIAERIASGELSPVHSLGGYDVSRTGTVQVLG